MAKVTPNEKCPCGSEIKFKKCCLPYLQGQIAENPDRLLRVRYAAQVMGQIQFLWETLHPESPRRLRDTWSKFESEHKLLKNLEYRGFKVLDSSDSSSDEAIFVYYTQVWDGHQDLSYLEEAKFCVFEGRWYYFDGLRKNSSRLGCNPESIKIGELETLFLHGSKMN